MERIRMMQTMPYSTTAALAELRSLSDWQLSFLAGRLTQKIACMHTPSTRSAAAMLQQYIERLDAVRAEIARRAAI